MSFLKYSKYQEEREALHGKWILVIMVLVVFILIGLSTLEDYDFERHQPPKCPYCGAPTVEAK